MSDVKDDEAMTGADPAPTRRIYELQEQIAELQQRLAEQVERERVLNLELVHARRDVEVKSAYIATMERQVAEVQAASEKARVASDSLVAWLKSQVERQQQRADQADNRRRELRAELDATRAQLGSSRRGRIARAARNRLEHHPRALRVARAARRALR